MLRLSAVLDTGASKLILHCLFLKQGGFRGGVILGFTRLPRVVCAVKRLFPSFCSALRQPAIAHTRLISSERASGAAVSGLPVRN